MWATSIKTRRAMPPATCAICCSARLTPARTVECSFCHETACRACVERFLCSTQDDAACMFCHNRWGVDHLSTLMTKSFLSGPYKEHRRHVLFQRELAMLPATQPYLEQEVQRRKNVKLMDEVLRERNELKRKIAELDTTLHTLERNLQPRLDTSKRAFVHRCGRPDCTGWLSTAWKCATCEHYTCPDCNAVKGLQRDAPHECDPAAKASVALIRSDCKKCPGCGQYIQRVEGCAQMWCTECHTAFDYNTGLKINGHIHNPHWYEFQRSGGAIARLACDVPCGGFPHYAEVAAAVRGVPLEATSGLFLMHRLITHLEDRELRSYPIDLPADANVALRVSWMLGETDRDTMQRQLQIREKASLKKRDIGLVLRMVVDASADLLRQFVLAQNGRTAEQRIVHTADVVEQLRRLFAYANSALRSVSQRYNCVVPQIQLTRYVVYTETWRHLAGAAVAPSAEAR